MDNLVANYVGRLNESSDGTDASLTIGLLHDVLNAEQEKKGKKLCALNFSIFITSSCSTPKIIIHVLELNFEVLFKDETTGIISYLRSLSKKNDINSDLIKEILNLLRCIVIDFTDVSAKYMSSLVVSSE